MVLTSSCMNLVPYVFTLLAVLPGLGFGQKVQMSTTRAQPVMQYLVRDPEQLPQQKGDGSRRINPFIAYTHIGTDFGFHGPGERFLSWENGRICVGLIGQEEWAGMWHSLSGMASSSAERMNFTRYYPAWITEAHQPEVTGVRFQVNGSGRLKLEIKSADQVERWSHMQEVKDPELRFVTVPVPGEKVPDGKFLSWTAEPGSGLCISTIQLVVDVPEMEFDQYVLLTSYAKLADCYCTATGLVRDRAHISPGSFDSMPATGYFALATAAMADPAVGIVSAEEAKRLVRSVHQAVSAIPHAMGLLPHFTVHKDGRNQIHPGTEYSTVDTAIYAFAMLLASEMLGDAELKADILRQVRAMDFAKLRLADGRITHGTRDDGKTLIPFSWGDWGGETALVMLLERLSGSKLPPPPMQRTAWAWQGTGFITEIQSQFFPDFDQARPDAASGANWMHVRQRMLAEQKDYFPKNAPDSFAAQNGLYGLSAGEGTFGSSYDVNGVDLKGAKVVHPHYILMSGVVEQDTAEVYKLLKRMDGLGYLTTLGMVENISVSSDRYLPMLGALNAGFEVLGAYHLAAKHRQRPNAIYAAALRSPEIREAMKLFYP
jgi:hypothetical protein